MKHYRAKFVDLMRCFFPGGGYAVDAMRVLGHVPDPRRLLRDMRALLVPGGRLVICVPNPAYTMAGEFPPLFKVDALRSRLIGEAALPQVAQSA